MLRGLFDAEKFAQCRTLLESRADRTTLLQETGGDLDQTVRLLHDESVPVSSPIPVAVVDHDYHGTVVGQVDKYPLNSLSG